MTAIGPVVATTGTVAVSSVGETCVKPALEPPKVTEVAPARFVPAIVTSVPPPPEVGANDEIVGCAGGGGAGTTKW